MQDLQRRKNEKLNELEEEERVKGEHLREKANEMLQEQEDEIKHLNEVIFVVYMCYGEKVLTLQTLTEIKHLKVPKQ